LSSPRTAGREGDLGAQAAKGTAVTLVAQILRIVVMLVSTVALARLVDPVDYGLITMVLAVTAVGEVFRDFGLSMAALQAKTLTQYQKSNLFWINSAVGVLLALIVFGLSWPIAAFYDRPELVPVVQIMSSVYLLGAVGAQFRVAINRSLRFVSLALCDLLPPVIGLAGALVFAVSGEGLAALVTQQVLTALATLVITVALAKWWPSLPRRGQDMRALLSFGVSFAATQLLTYLTRNVDSIAIGRVSGAVSLGLYDRAFQLSVAPINQVNAPMSRVAVPVLVRMRDDRPRFEAALRKAQLVACYVTASGLFVLAGVGTPLVVALLGPQWESAGTILSVLAVGTVFRAVQQISYWMFMAQGMAGAQLRLYLVGQPLIVAALLAGLPWGPVGVAVGSAVGYAGFWLLSLWWAGRASSIKTGPLAWDALRAIAVFGAPAGVVAFAATVVAGPSVVWQLVFGILAAVLWFLLVFLLSKTVRRDCGTLWRFAGLATRGRK